MSIDLFFLIQFYFPQQYSEKSWSPVVHKYTSFDTFETCQVNRRAEFEQTKIIVPMSSNTYNLKIWMQ